jgi:acetyl esterase/lipase
MPVLTSLALLLVADPFVPRPADVVRRYDLPYAAADAKYQKIDLVVPKAGGPHPVVVCIHGGAWKIGSRQDLSKPPKKPDPGADPRCFLDRLADKGFAAASVGYRLAPKDRFPAQIADAKAAIRYLRANAAALNLDPDRVAVMGFSAGGHLAALVGTTPGRPEFDPGVFPGQSDRVSCVVNVFGPTDLTLYRDTPGVDRAIIAPLLGPEDGSADLHAKASPLTYVTRDAPPFLTIHGTADLVVPVIHAERLHEKLLAAGAKSEFYPVRGEGHGWGEAVVVETSAVAVRFLAKHLQAAGGE